MSKIDRYITKPAMDLTRDPRFNTFKMEADDLKNQRSTNIQIQHYFNSIHHPNSVRMIAIGQNDVTTPTEQGKELKAKIKIDQTVILD